MALDEIAEDVIARTGPEVLAKVMEIVFSREMELEEQLLRAALSQAGIDLEPEERVLRVEPVATLGEPTVSLRSSTSAARLGQNTSRPW